MNPFIYLAAGHDHYATMSVWIVIALIVIAVKAISHLFKKDKEENKETK